MSSYINLTFFPFNNLQVFKITLFVFYYLQTSLFLLFLSLPHLRFSALFMASESENSPVGLVELDELEVMEIDEALLRELLEEEEEEEVDAEGERLVESVENGNKMVDEKEVQKQKDSCSEQHEGCNEFEWVNNMMQMEPASQDEVILNWYPDDMVGMMADFGYANEELSSQICEGLGSYEASYSCLWEDL